MIARSLRASIRSWLIKLDFGVVDVRRRYVRGDRSRGHRNQSGGADASKARSDIWPGILSRPSRPAAKHVPPIEIRARVRTPRNLGKNRIRQRTDDRRLAARRRRRRRQQAGCCRPTSRMRSRTNRFAAGTEARARPHHRASTRGRCGSTATMSFRYTNRSSSSARAIGTDFGVAIVITGFRIAAVIELERRAAVAREVERICGRERSAQVLTVVRRAPHVRCVAADNRLR